MRVRASCRLGVRGGRQRRHPHVQLCARADRARLAVGRHPHRQLLQRHGQSERQPRQRALRPIKRRLDRVLPKCRGAHLRTDARCWRTGERMRRSARRRALDGGAATCRRFLIAGTTRTRLKRAASSTTSNGSWRACDCLCSAAASSRSTNTGHSRRPCRARASARPSSSRSMMTRGYVHARKSR